MNKFDCALYEHSRDYTNDLLDTLYTGGCVSHFHHQIEILWVKKGRITVRINDVEKKLTAGDVCIADSYDIHSYVVNDATLDVGYVLIISTHLLFDTSVKLKTFKENFLIGENANKIITLISYLEENLNLFSEMVIKGLCLTILGAFYDLLPNINKEEKGKILFMREVLRYIHENYKTNINLNCLSKKFGYNPSHFSRIFNSFIKEGFKDYLNKIRTMQALLLLKNGNNATCVAYLCGFNSIETFYRSFKKCFGVSPKLYLKNYTV